MLRCGTVSRAAPSKRPASCVERGPVLGLLAADVDVELPWAAVEAPHVPHAQVDEAQPGRWPRGARPSGPARSGLATSEAGRSCWTPRQRPHARHEYGPVDGRGPRHVGRPQMGRQAACLVSQRLRQHRAPLLWRPALLAHPFADGLRWHGLQHLGDALDVLKRRRLGLRSAGCRGGVVAGDHSTTLARMAATRPYTAAAIWPGFVRSQMVAVLVMQSPPWPPQTDHSPTGVHRGRAVVGGMQAQRFPWGPVSILMGSCHLP